MVMWVVSIRTLSAGCPHTNYQQNWTGILVLDAGAGTVDIGFYGVVQWSPITVEEMNISGVRFMFSNFGLQSTEDSH